MIKDKNTLFNMSSCIKMLSAVAVENAKSGHPGTPVGASDIITCLFANFIKISPQNPSWINRDRFVLSAGHACAMLYSTLYLLNFEKFNIESLKNLRQLHSITSGHPEIDHKAGIEVTTGPLGEGVSMAVGLAIAEAISSAKNPNIINNYTYAFVGDGCLMEGVSYEALSLAGHLKLNKLIVIYDNNNITIDGNLETANTENIALRMESFGFNVIKIDGHNFDEINKALEDSHKSDKPTFIFAKTHIAHLAGSKQDTESSHGSPLGETSITKLKENLNWKYDAFEIPEQFKKLWDNIANNNNKLYKNWESKYLNDKNFSDSIKNDLPKDFILEIEKLANESIANKSSTATRVCSGKVLELMQKYLPNVIGGSADLSQSNNTINKFSKAFLCNNHQGNYIHYGVREHAMGAIMNGIASYGINLIPYGGTFLVFSDFLKPALRLSALMEQQVIYVFTHDSISVGGDGPTHQPIEHLHSLNLIPNIDVLRPTDIIETIESYLIALNNKHKPTALILSRGNLPTLRDKFDINDNKVSKGGYILKCFNNPVINLISNGSELSSTLDVANKLFKEHNIGCNVISMPSLKLFKQQSNDYKNSVLKNCNLNIVIEANIITGYAEILNGKTIYKGIEEFGKSGNPEDALDYFGFTLDKLYLFILNICKKNNLI